MYLNILKKDLKRKKAMNIILLVFIILASMFISSSVNNIISVTSALDNYFEMAGVPDCSVMTMNKVSSGDTEEILKNADSIESLGIEDVIYMSQSQILKDGEPLNPSSGTQILQSDKDISMNYFLDDGSILKSVPEGKFYATVFVEKNAGLKIGDKVTFEIEGVSRELTFAGSFKDALLGPAMTSIARFIINSGDFEEYISDETINTLYGGKLCYINTSDMDKMLEEISGISEEMVLTADRALLRFTYVFDMIVTGILLVISLILIAVAFVVMRFTITFTLSEEFREIGVMKAIGIRNLKIRGLYLTKYAALAVTGALIGLIFSFPFGEMLISVSSTSIIISNQNTVFINCFCAMLVVAVILLFCFGCTGRVSKMSPIDAIRNGQTGERFRKKCLMNLSKSKLNATLFLALNDIVSSPKRYGIITFTFVLCLSLLLILSSTVTTMKSGKLLFCFVQADSDIFINNTDDMKSFMIDGGHEELEKYLDELENTLAGSGIPSNCMQEVGANLVVKHGAYESKIFCYQGTGTTMDMYVYTAGTAPENSNEIAITRLAADKINADIGDTVTIETVDGEQEYLITAFFQAMAQQGSCIRLHTDAELNYIQVSGGTNLSIKFNDNPDDKEINSIMEKIKEIYPKFTDIETSAEWVEEALGVTDALNAVKTMSAVLTIVLAILITVLMERSFIAKEQGEIALMKAMGMRNVRIYAYHAARFAAVGMIAVVIAEVFAFPLTHLCIDPVFKMMGMELAVDYVVNPIEMYLIFPVLILATTTAGAFLTSLYTRKTKSSDTANIE